MNNRWQFSDDLTWVKGRHTLKSGFEYRHHDFPFRGWAVGRGRRASSTSIVSARPGYDASGNNLGQTGDPFASFLLGQVQNANQTIPVAADVPRDVHRASGSTTSSRCRDKLTLTLGLRFDYQSARTESNDQYSTFDPNTPNPGAGEHSGRADLRRATARAGPGTRTFEDPPKDAWGPRVGLRLSRRRQETRSAAATGSTTRASRSISSSGSRRLGFQANPLAPNTDERDPAGVPSRQGLPGRIASCSRRSSTRRSANGDGAHRGGAGRPDAAALPELVGHVPAPAHRAT